MTLWLTDRLPFLWQWLGINYPQLRAILSVKLMLDNRRPMASLNTTKQQQTATKDAYWRSVGVYAFLGLFASLTLAFAPRETILLPLVLYFGYVMAVCAMLLITDFSSVVLDSADNQILLFRPVDSRTLLIARIVHIASYLFTFALAVGAAGILIMGWRFGPAAGLFMPLLVLLAATLTLFLTNVLYLLLMRFTSEERLREAINYLQIGMGVLFYGGFQLMPRLMSSTDVLEPAPFVWQGWHLLLPPFWCAGSLNMLLNGAGGGLNWLALGLILTVPFLGLWLMSRVLSSVFAERLAGLDTAQKQPVQAPAAAAAGAPGKRSLAVWLSGWLTSSPLERASFLMIWHLTGRDRKFKLKTYPSLAFGIIYLVTMNLRGTGAGGGFSHLFILYICGVYVLGALMQVTISDNYKAAWIYEAAPISQPGKLLAGGLKAVVVKLMLPYFAIMAAYVFYIKGSAVAADVLLALLGSLVVVLVAALSNNRSLPFSMSQDAIRQNMSARSMISLLIVVVIGAVHWGLTYVPYGVWAAIPVMLLVAGLLFRTYRQTGWEQIMIEG